MRDVEIYGEVVASQSSRYFGNGYCNLSYVRGQLNEAKGADVRVRINCFGGDVEEGFAIYSELRRYAGENAARVITLAEGRCASIATVIFLAGDERLVTEYTELYVHNAWLHVKGNSIALERAGRSLEACNERIARHYELHTNLTYTEARGLMDEESFITPGESVAMRFATGIEEVARPLAKYIIRRLGDAKKSGVISNDKVNIKDKEMSKNSKKLEEVFGKFKNQMRALFSSGTGAVNKLMYTASEAELNFYELGEAEAVKLGDMATLEGELAEGEITMSTGEVYVFEAGRLTEIKPPESENPEVYDRLDLVEEAIGELLDRVQGLAVENKRLVSVLNKVSGETPTNSRGERLSKAMDNKARDISTAIDELRKSRRA